MDWLKYLEGTWHYIALGLTVVVALLGSGHALLHKRDPRAAVLWVSLIWLVPLGGALLYFALGVNRIRRRAALLRGGLERFQSRPAVRPCGREELNEHLPEGAKHLSTLARLVEGVVIRPLLPGNRMEALVDGDQAYPAMLEGIGSARHTISLSTYIFDRDTAGAAFASALGKAVRRGVDVRVLIDATGTHYSWPTILPALRGQGIRAARFLPTFPTWRLGSVNLRNHRKILVVDGQLGFTGGINIRAGHRLGDQPRRPVQDVHFRVEGPVVSQLQEVFAEDWLFTTGEALRGDAWFPEQPVAGRVIARVISDGPDEDFEKLRWTVLGALTAARSTVRIVTPYFLPDTAIISALNLAVMRGVTVDIVLPSKSNLRFVDWASRAMWWQVLERGCRIWLSAPPFDHSKLMVVDNCWALVGSANWDARSLRLNFELNLESYDCEVAAALDELISDKLGRARRITLREMDSRPLPAQLRDGLARLFTPYL